MIYERCEINWLLVYYVVIRKLTNELKLISREKPHFSKVARISTMIHRIIFLLLLMEQDRASSTRLGGDITADTNLRLNESPYVVSQDLVVAENATLTIHPGVQLYFETGVGLQVKGSLQAKGNPRQRILFTKSPINNTYNDGIRLSDGNSSTEGRLEIFVGHQWIPACDNRWDMRNAEVTYMLSFNEFSFPHTPITHITGFHVASSFSKLKNNRCLILKF